MTDLKVGVIGAGSIYTPELIEGFIKRQNELNVSRIVLMDINVERLKIVGGLAQRMVKRAGSETIVELTTEREPALKASDYVITQIRVAGMQGRALDEKIPLGLGVIGQETTGPGGFAMALRTIPVMLDIARQMESLSPEGWLINFTNPSGLITEALTRYADVNVVGLCNAPITYINRLAALLEVEGRRITLDYFGLNHLTWIRGVYLDGHDVTPKVMAAILGGKAQDLPGYVFNPTFVKALNLIPCGYLQYYYHRDQVLAALLAAEKCRAEIVMDIERELLEMYQDPTLKEKPKLLEQRGGAWYSDAAVQLISALENDKREVHVVNVRNQGALTDLSPDSVVEVPALVSRAGPRPLTVGAMPRCVRGLVQQVKAYEELTIEAAVHGCEQSAQLALGNHPLVSNVNLAEALWHKLKEAHRSYLPHFEDGS